MNGSIPFRRLAFFVVALAVMTLVGCGGGKRTKVKGTLVLPAGVTVGPQDSLTITLIPTSAEKSGPPPSGGVDPKALTFVVDGADHKGIAPGKYKVYVSCTPYPGDNLKERKEKLDKAFAPFLGDKSTLEVDLSDGSDHTITVDLEKKTVSK